MRRLVHHLLLLVGIRLLVVDWRWLGGLGEAEDLLEIVEILRVGGLIWQLLLGLAVCQEVFEQMIKLPVLL